MTKYFKADRLFVASNETNSMYIHRDTITIDTLLDIDYWRKEKAKEITKEEFLSELESTNKNIESFTQQITK